jgi:hypothetical protein
LGGGGEPTQLDEISQHNGDADSLEPTGRSEQELIEIAAGGTYYNAVYGRKHWYSILKTCLRESGWEYSLEDQLAAVEALGNAGGREALEFSSPI